MRSPCEPYSHENPLAPFRLLAAMELHQRISSLEPTGHKEIPLMEHGIKQLTDHCSVNKRKLSSFELGSALKKENPAR